MGHGKASDGVHHEEDFFAGIAKIFGDGGGEHGSAEADECWLVGGGADDHRSAHAFLAEIFFDELAEFASAFTDESDDIDVAFCAFGHHAEEGGFSDAATGKNSHALAAADGGKGIDGPNAGGEGFGDALAAEGIGRWIDEFERALAVERALTVDGLAEAIDGATDEAWADGGRGGEI